MATEYQEELIVSGGPVPLTSGYMLSVKVSSHPAMSNGNEDSTSQVYTLTVVAIDQQSVSIAVSYIWGAADISNSVSNYLFTVTDGACSSPMPPAPPTLVTTVAGAACFSFQKLTAYQNDHTFKITVSSPDATNSATTQPF